MSDLVPLFEGFVQVLRESEVPVTLHALLDFRKAMALGLIRDVDTLLLVSRLCFVKKVEYLDPFERAFAKYFFGITLPAAAQGDEAILQSRPFRAWLAGQMNAGALPYHALWSMPKEELMKRFWDTVKRQFEEHHGGNTWVGTGGTSPFGHSGLSARGVRVMGASSQRSALQVIGDRRYVDYSAQRQFSQASLRTALSYVKALRPRGPEDQLDLPATIARSAKAGGDIELAFSRSMKNDFDIVLLLDNGGNSMSPHIDLVAELFSHLRDKFRKLTVFYFHNTIYGTVWKDARRTIPHSILALCELPKDHRLLVVGDAAMAPEELLSPHGSIGGQPDPLPSFRYLEQCKRHFRVCRWLNPISRGEWAQTHGNYTISRIGEIIPMDDFTLGGLKRAMEHLVQDI